MHGVTVLPPIDVYPSYKDGYAAIREWLIPVQVRPVDVSYALSYDDILLINKVCKYVVHTSYHRNIPPNPWHTLVEYLQKDSGFTYWIDTMRNPSIYCLNFIYIVSKKTTLNGYGYVTINTSDIHDLLDKFEILKFHES